MCVSECCLGNSVDMVGVALREVARLLHLTPQPHQHHLHNTEVIKFVFGLTKKRQGFQLLWLLLEIPAWINQFIPVFLLQVSLPPVPYLSWFLFLFHYWAPYPSCLSVPTCYFQSRQLLLMILKQWANSCFFWCSLFVSSYMMFLEHLLSFLSTSSYLIFLEQPVEFPVRQFIPDVSVAACWVPGAARPICPTLPGVACWVEVHVCQFKPDVPGAACPICQYYTWCSWSSLLSSLFVCSYLMFL